MRTNRPLCRSTVAALSLVLAACASSGGGATPEAGAQAPASGQVGIEVNNDLIPPSEVTVWLIPENGGRRRLGSLSPNGRRTFEFASPNIGMQYTLEADVSGGQNRSSNPFLLRDVSRVQWNVSEMNVRVVR